MNSSYNFRDIGGYEAAGGKHVRWRMLIRCGDFPNLSAEDVLLLRSYNIHSVVDFRAIDESSVMPDAMISSGVQTFHLPIDAGHLVPHFKRLLSDEEVDEEAKMRKADELMMTMYRGLATDYDQQYSTFFKILSSPVSAPLLYHCSAGKDRTGFATALLLTALGVDREVIFTDYLLTNEALRGKYDHLNHIGRLVFFFKSVRKEYLIEAFSVIKRRAGTAEKYITDVLNVDVDCLRRVYLE